MYRLQILHTYTHTCTNILASRSETDSFSIDMKSVNELKNDIHTKKETNKQKYLIVDVIKMKDLWIYVRNGFHLFWVEIPPPLCTIKFD